MGIGDELMASGQAKAMWLRDRSRKVYIMDMHGRGRWSPVWDGVPYIMHPATPRLQENQIQRLLNGPSARPYIAMKTVSRWTWRDFKPTPADMYFKQAELDVADYHAGCVIIEPNYKAKASPNKDWGWQRWSELAALLIARGFKVRQVGPRGTRTVPGVRLIETADFRTAAAVLSRARGAVLPEGGLHHAAAAVRVPTVVIFGGYISPSQTGYESHINLFTGSAPCGNRNPRIHCQKAMEKIRADETAKLAAEHFK